MVTAGPLLATKLHAPRPRRGLVARPRLADAPDATDTRKAARVAGVLYLVSFVTSIPALILYGPLLNHSDYILGGGADSQVLLGGLLEVLCALASIGTAVACIPRSNARTRPLRSVSSPRASSRPA